MIETEGGADETIHLVAIVIYIIERFAVTPQACHLQQGRVKVRKTETPARVSNTQKGRVECVST